MFNFLVLAFVLVVIQQSSAGVMDQIPGGMPDPSSFVPKEMAEHVETAKSMKDMAAAAMPTPDSMKTF